MCFSILGSISVKLMPRLEMDKGRFGTLISAFMFCCLIASLIVGVLVDTLGFQPLAIAGFVITAVCFFLLARGKSFGAAVTACVLLGFGAMALNTAGNTMIPMVLFGGEDPAAASNLGNVFFGLGLFLTPLIVSFLFQRMSFESAVTVLAVIVLLPVIFALTATYPKAPGGFALGDAVALLKEPAVIVAALVLFCYIALESSFCNWLPPFGKEVVTVAEPEAEESVADAKGQRMLSTFAIMMMVGRLLTSQIPNVTEIGTYVIAGAALVSGIAIVMMMATKSTGAAYALAGLGGLAFAPCFPTTVGVTFSKFTPNVYGSVFGIIFAVGLAGAVIVPKAIGNLSEGSSVQKSLKLLLPACVVLIVLALVLRGVEGPASEAPEAPTTPVEEVTPGLDVEPEPAGKAAEAPDPKAAPEAPAPK
jgi:fucose permease